MQNRPPVDCRRSATVALAAINTAYLTILLSLVFSFFLLFICLGVSRAVTKSEFSRGAYVISGNDVDRIGGVGPEQQYWEIRGLQMCTFWWLQL